MEVVLVRSVEGLEIWAPGGGHGGSANASVSGGVVGKGGSIIVGSPGGGGGNEGGVVVGHANAGHGLRTGAMVPVVPEGFWVLASVVVGHFLGEGVALPADAVVFGAFALGTYLGGTATFERIDPSSQGEYDGKRRVEMRAYLGGGDGGGVGGAGGTLTPRGGAVEG